MITLYGIANCDTVKKARRWLDDAGIDHRFHDVRADGLTRDVVQAWIDELGWEPLVNTRGTTWRRLPEQERAALDRDAAAALMLAHPTVIKRPVWDLGDHRRVGFAAKDRDGLEVAVRAAG